MDRGKKLLARIETLWAELAREISGEQRQVPPEQVDSAARQLVELAVFVAMCRQRGLPDRADSSLLPEMEAPLEEFENVLQEVGDEVARQPPSWLGPLHEHLLSRRLIRTPSGRFTPRVASKTRKAAGVFYTPDYVVEYIINRSLQPLILEQPNFAEQPAPAVIDPACGSGAFLLVAGRLLLDVYHDLPAREAAHRMADSLHGMDLDPDAVLAARRALWLTVVDTRGINAVEGLATALAANIRRGNALADSVPCSSDRLFDVVVGNPPYRRELGTKQLLDRIVDTRLGRQFRQARMDLWYYFLHRGLELLKPGGRLSMIVGSYWTAGAGSKKLLSTIRDHAQIEEIFLLDRLRVFSRVAGRHMILTLRKKPCVAVAKTTIKRIAADQRDDAEPFVRGSRPVTVFEKASEQLFRFGRIDIEPPADELLAKIARGVPLGRLGIVRQGIVENPASVTAAMNRRHGNRWQTGEGVFALSPHELAQLGLPENETSLIRPYHDLCDLGRHFLAEQPSRRLIYTTSETCPDIARFPKLRRHLARFRPIMVDRRETRLGGRPWWQLHWPRDEQLWRRAKVVSVQMGRRPAFVAATEPTYVPFSTNVFASADSTREHIHYFAAVLGSRLLWLWFRHTAKHRGVGLEINGHVLSETPIRPIDFLCPNDRRRHDELVVLVERLMRLNCETSEATQEISSIDQRIDELVYELYELTDTQVAAVVQAEL